MSNLFQNVIAPLFIAVEITFQQVREKEKPEYGEHYKQFDQDDSPKLPAPGHASESIIIEPECLSNHEE